MVRLRGPCPPPPWIWHWLLIVYKHNDKLVILRSVRNARRRTAQRRKNMCTSSQNILDSQLACRKMVPSNSSQLKRFCPLCGLPSRVVKISVGSGFQVIPETIGHLLYKKSWFKINLLGFEKLSYVEFFFVFQKGENKSSSCWTVFYVKNSLPQILQPKFVHNFMTIVGYYIYD